MKKLKYYPAFLNINDKKAVIVGGGEVAARKIDMLLSAGASIVVISPTIDTKIEKISHLLGEIILKQYQKGDLAGAFIAIAATDNDKLNQQVATDAKAENIMVNIITSPKESDFLVPSVVNNGELVIAISTGGKSPALSKKIRKELQQTFGDEYRQFSLLLGEIRKTLIGDNIADSQQRGIMLNEIVNSNILTLLKEKKYKDIAERLEQITGFKLNINIINSL